jgi:GxxExxY protein
MNHQEHEGHQGSTKERDALARAVVDSGLKVHRTLGPGLFESVYEHCLVHELGKRGLTVQRQVFLPVTYDGETLDAAYRLDVLVENTLIIEIKAIDALSRVHEAQILTYLRLSGFHIGFLMNFNAPLFKDGVRRFVL